MTAVFHKVTPTTMAAADLRNVQYFLTRQGNSSELLECKEIEPGQNKYACTKKSHVHRLDLLDHNLELECTRELPEEWKGKVFSEGTEICSIPKELWPTLQEVSDSGGKVDRELIMSMDQAKGLMKNQAVPLGGCACGH